MGVPRLCRGRKTASTDPDLGHWTYAYDTANELVSQTDAKNQTSTFNYDKLGLIGMRVLRSNLSVTLRYCHAGNLGSMAVITDGSGAVVEHDIGACPPAGEAGPEERLGRHDRADAYRG